MPAYGRPVRQRAAGQILGVLVLTFLLGATGAVGAAESVVRAVLFFVPRG